jgi:hypothetical protein
VPVEISDIYGLFHSVREQYNNRKDILDISQCHSLQMHSAPLFDNPKCTGSVTPPDDALLVPFILLIAYLPRLVIRRRYWTDVNRLDRLQLTAVPGDHLTYKIYDDKGLPDSLFEMVDLNVRLIGWGRRC